MTAKAIATQSEFVLERVKKYLEPRQPESYHLNIIGIKRDDDYLYVVVQPDRDDIRAYDYYNILAEFDNDMEEIEKLNVLIVPALPGM